MKSTYTNTSSKDTITAGTLLAVLFIGIVGGVLASFTAHATEPVVATEKLEAIVVTAPRMKVERLNVIVITASRANAA